VRQRRVCFIRENPFIHKATVVIFSPGIFFRLHGKNGSFIHFFGVPNAEFRVEIPALLKKGDSSKIRIDSFSQRSSETHTNYEKSLPSRPSTQASGVTCHQPDRRLHPAVRQPGPRAIVHCQCLSERHEHVSAVSYTFFYCQFSGECD